MKPWLPSGATAKSFPCPLKSKSGYDAQRLFASLSVPAAAATGTVPTATAESPTATGVAM